MTYFPFFIHVNFEIWYVVDTTPQFRPATCLVLSSHKGSNCFCTGQRRARAGSTEISAPWHRPQPLIQLAFPASITPRLAVAVDQVSGVKSLPYLGILTPYPHSYLLITDHSLSSVPCVLVSFIQKDLLSTS